MNNNGYELIYLTGFSQGGTTLLMSLLDYHPDLLVYPDEPAFGRLFKRAPNYKSPRHIAADFLFGTPNPIHLASEAGTKNIKGKKFPAATENEFARIGTVLDQNWIERKKLRGIPENEFDHAGFFKKYHGCLIKALIENREITPKMAVTFAFEALENAYPAAARGRRIRTFKGPLSGVSVTKLDWFRTHFKGAIVFIYRHPHARLYSQILHFRQKGRSQCAPRLRESFLGFVRLCIHNAREQNEAQKIAKLPYIISINYEDLVNDCEKTMKNLCRQLDIPFNEIVLKPTKLGIAVKNPTDRTGGDGAVSNASLYKYKKGLTFWEKMIFSIILAGSRPYFMFFTQK